MATFTHLGLDEARGIAAAHGLPECNRVVPVVAGTVNSNYFLETAQGRVFVRIYEQQETDGVAYEWRLLAHLRAQGVPVPARIEGPAPGGLRVGGKPVAVFAEVRGEDLCQALVTPARARPVGGALGQAHRASASFPEQREGRFRLEDVAHLLARAESAGRAELAAPIARLRALHDELRRAAPQLGALPRGVTHGDLFRDNVLWQDERIVALLDWESASDGILAYDLAVILLAWCCGDSFDFTLARAMVDGYREQRALSDAEWTGLWWTMRLGCLRFATTRITDVYLKGSYPAGYKDFRRFLLRLDIVESLTPAELAEQLGR
jgi:homoserine kinase type II